MRCVEEAYLSLSAGAATPRMRSKTTTNSAPWAAVTLSKQRPRPSERIIHRTYPIKSSPPTAGRPQTAPAQWQMPPERRKTFVPPHVCPHTHTHRAWALVRTASYSQVSAPSQCLRSPTPHRDRNTVIQQSVCGRKVASSRPGVIVAFSSTGLFVSPFQINIGTCEMRGKKNRSAAMASFASLAFWKLLQPSPGNTVY